MLQFGCHDAELLQRAKRHYQGHFVEDFRVLLSVKGRKGSELF